MPVPLVMVVAPPPITRPAGAIAPKFDGGAARCHGLAEAYRTVCADLDCSFFDAASVVTASPHDGVHLDAAEHAVPGRALVAPADALLRAER